jgi:putative hydrolase of the HAD superfamily
MSKLDLIGFDADDTLWHNLIHFDDAQKQFGQMLSNFTEPNVATALLIANESRNISALGFGVKSFTLSMIETAIEISGGKIESAVISKLITMGRDMLDHEIELLPHAEEALKALHSNHKLILITKGDLHHQERKVLASGLAHYFEAIEIVSDKKPETYQKICKRYGASPANSMMAGNSIKSDIMPMIKAGGYGVYVPFEILWSHEHEEVPLGTERFFEVKDLSELEAVIQKLGTP